MSRLRLSLLLAAILMACTVVAASAADWSDYVDSLGDRLDSDWDINEKYLKLYEESPLETQAQLDSVAGSFDELAKNFDSSAEFYRETPPPGTPQELVDSAADAATGSAAIAGGARQAAVALRADDDADLESAFAELNRGMDSMSASVDHFNQYVDRQDEYAASDPTSVEFYLAKARIYLIPATIILGAPTLIVAVYLLIAGSILNRVFRKRLAPYIGTAAPALLPSTPFPKVSLRPRAGEPLHLFSGGLAFVYGIHLILSVVFSYVVLLLSVVLVLDFGTVLVWLLLLVNHIPVALALALAIVIFASLWAVFRGVFLAGRGKSVDVAVAEADEPGLWEISREVAADMGTRPADVILLSPGPGIGVTEEGGLGQFLVGRTRRLLLIGMPSIIGLTVSQFKSILAHEYGHFSNRDTAWCPLTFRAGAALSETIGEMRSIRRAGGWVSILSRINPAQWMLTGYALVYYYLTGSFSRSCEVMADQSAVRLYGSPAFKGGLQQIVLNDTFFDSELGPRMQEMAAEGKSFVNIYQSLEQEEREADAEKINEVRRGAVERPPSKLDTHPPVRDRLSYVDSFIQEETCIDDRPVYELFADWQARSNQLSELLSDVMIAAMKG